MLPPRYLPYALAACLFALVTGAKWATFDRYGSPMPDWDQWDAEAVNLFIPWFENDRFTEHLFKPHNEHRVVLTKLQSLVLVLANGQWDSRLEAVTNALLHAALATAFWAFTRRWVAGPWSAALFVLTALLTGLPLAWQNILGGFHSQQYWLLALSFATIITLPFAPAWRLKWWFGTACAALALGSMGSGLLAAAIVLIFGGWRWMRARIRFRDTWPAMLVCAAIIAFGLLTRVEVYYHEHMKVKTAHDFVLSILRSLEWPLRDQDWAGVILWAPWALVCGRALRGQSEGFLRKPDHSHSRPAWAPPDEQDVITITALGAWVLVQIVATAYARGAGADYPASRYMDTLAFGTMVNGLSLAWLLSVKRPAKIQRCPHYALAALWLITLIVGLAQVLARNLRHELPDAKKYYVKAEANLRRYLATNDARYLANQDIPFPSADGLVERLAHQSLRVLMPVPIRPPLELQPAETSAVFQENDARHADPKLPPRRGLSSDTAPLDALKTWGSFTGSTAATERTGTWKSHPVTPGKFGWLVFETAGDVTPPRAGASLSLLDAENGAVLTPITPTKTPGDSWRAAYVPSPQKAFLVAAKDDAAAPWLAFSSPVEMGAGSYWAWQAVKNGRLILWIALGATAACAFAAWQASRGTRPPF